MYGVLYSLDYDIEEVLVFADKKALRVITPFARCAILLLRFLRNKPQELDDLMASLEGYGVKCRDINRTLKYFKEHGLVECNPRCVLTEFGIELSDSIHDILENIRSFAYKVLEGSYEENDVLTELLTPTASSVGLIEAYVEDPSLFLLYLAIHTYISALSSTILSVLARADPRLLITIRVVAGVGS